MKTYFVKTPKFIAFYFKNYIWYSKKGKREIYLTFDDGPTPEVTKFVLKTLKKYNAKATFFCLGKNIENNQDLFRRIVKEEHVIGNHTQNHVNGWKTNTDTYIANVEQCQRVINYHVKSGNLKLYRPPYGKITKKQAKILLKRQYKIIMWSVLSADFDTKITKEKCLQNVLKNTNDGNIIVLHDSVKAFKKLKYVLPKVLEYYTEKGYYFKGLY